MRLAPSAAAPGTRYGVKTLSTKQMIKDLREYQKVMGKRARYEKIKLNRAVAEAVEMELPFGDENIHDEL